jgi:ribosomal protein L39E
MGTKKQKRRRVRLTTNRDVPLWGATRTKAKVLARQRDLDNEIFRLGGEIADRDQTIRRLQGDLDAANQRARNAEDRLAAIPKTTSAESLAFYIYNWLERRNGGELAGPLGNQRVSDRKLALDELALILKHGGKPPNWVS